MTFSTRVFHMLLPVIGATLMIVGIFNYDAPWLIMFGITMIGMPATIRGNMMLLEGDMSQHQPIKTMGCEIVGGEFADTKCNWGTSGCRLYHEDNPPLPNDHPIYRKVVEDRQVAAGVGKPSTKGQIASISARPSHL